MEEKIQLMRSVPIMLADPFFINHLFKMCIPFSWYYFHRYSFNRIEGIGNGRGVDDTFIRQLSFRRFSPCLEAFYSRWTTFVYFPLHLPESWNLDKSFNGYMDSLISLTIIVNIIRQSTVPWGTPRLIFKNSVVTPSIFTFWVRLVKKSISHFVMGGLMDGWFS